MIELICFVGSCVGSFALLNSSNESALNLLLSVIISACTYAVSILTKYLIIKLENKIKSDKNLTDEELDKILNGKTEEIAKTDSAGSEENDNK